MAATKINGKNPMRERLKKGELAIGIGLRQARTVDVAPAMKTCGYDWLFIDCEHNSMTLDMAVQISVAANACGISPIVRVPQGQLTMATRVLDGGAYGIVMPHVDTPEEAQEIATKLRYPPVGRRSIGGTMPQLGFAQLPPGESTKIVNDNLLVIVMLESPLSIKNADAIAAVKGVDVLLIGTSDLTMEMGLPGQLMHPKVVEAYQIVVDACKKHKKWAGMGGVYTDEGLTKYIGMGVTCVLAGSDMSFLMQAATAREKHLRGLK